MQLGSIGFAMARWQAATRASPWGMALAASFVGVVVGLSGFLLGQSNGTAPDGANLALNEALETLPSGGDRALSDAESLHMIASFRDAEGHLCREYERKAADAVTTAVACHGPAGWQTRFALTNPVAEGYVPASTTDTLDAFLSGIGAGAQGSAAGSCARRADRGRDKPRALACRGDGGGLGLAGEGRRRELAEVGDGLVDDAVGRAFLGGKVEQDRVDVGVDEVGGDLRAHHAGAEHGHLADAKLRHG